MNKSKMESHNCFECYGMGNECYRYLPPPRDNTGQCQYKTSAEECLEEYLANIKIMPHEEAMPKNQIFWRMLLEYLGNHPELTNDVI